MKQKTRKLGIQLKIMIPTILVLILACVFMGGSSYVQINNGMVELGVEQAEMARQPLVAERMVEFLRRSNRLLTMLVK